MFSSFLSTVSSSFQSPKSLLSSYLASSLGEFFEVDPALIQSNLLQDTKIVLQDIRLKPIYEKTLVVDGVVSEIEFSWTWGGDGTTQFVRDVVLKIRGANFRLRQMSGDSPIAVTDSKVTVATTDPNDEQAGYLSRAVQQITDHLTLQIFDFELAIETPQQDTVTFRSKELQLSTFGREEQGLSQRISFTDLAAFVNEAGGNSQVSLLDPVSYSALVTRTSGRRFVDGAKTGLQVKGGLLPGEDSADVVLHAGCIQVRALSRVAEMFIMSTAETAQNSDQVGSTQENGLADAIDPLASVVVLPLPSLSVILPNDAKIHMPNGTFSYRMDGSVCELVGTQGVLINESVPFLSLEQQVEWKLDVAKSKVCLQYQKYTQADGTNKEPSHQMASMLWNETEMKKFICSLQELSESASSKVIEEVEEVVAREVEAHVKSTWSLSAPGSISLRVQGANEESLEATLLKPYVAVAPDGSLSDLQLGQLILGPTTSFGEVAVSIPTVKLVEGELCLDEPIQLSVPSIAIVEEIGSFVQRLVDTGLSSTRPSIEHTSGGIPMSIRIPKIGIALVDLNELNIEITGVAISKDMKVYLQAVTAKDASSMVVICKMIEVDQSEGIVCRLGEIETFHVPGLLAFENPVKDAKISFCNGTLEVAVPVIAVKPLFLDNEASPSDAATTVDTAPLSLPFPCRLKLERVSFSPSNRIDASVHFKGIDASIVPGDDDFVIKTQSAIAIRVRQTASLWVGATVGPLSSKLDQASNGTLSVKAFAVGEIVLATSQAIGEMRVAIPGATFTGTEIVIEGNAEVSKASQAVVEAIQQFADKIITSKNQDDASTCVAFESPFGIPISIHKVNVNIEEPTAISVGAVGVSLGKNTLQCKSIAFREASGSSVSVSKVTVTGGSTLRIHLGQLDSLYVPHSLKLTSPSKDMTWEFVDGALSSNIDTASITLLRPCETASQNAPGENPLPLPTQLKIKNLVIAFEGVDHISAKVENIDLLAVPVEESISLGNDDTIAVRLSLDKDGNWVEARFAGLYAVATPTADGWNSTSLGCGLIRVGPSSYGHIEMLCNGLTMPSNSNEISVDDDVSVTLGSPALAEETLSMLRPLMSFYEKKGAQPSPTQARLVKVSLASIEPQGQCTVEGIVASSSSVACEKIIGHLGDGSTAALSRLTATLSDPPRATIECIESFHLPQICALEQPMQGTTITFADQIFVHSPMIKVVILSAKDAQGFTAKKSNGTTIPCVPLAVRVSLDEARVRPSAGAANVMVLSKVDLCAKPLSPDVFSAPPEQKRGTYFEGTVDVVKNPMMEVSALRFSGAVHENTTDSVQNFFLSLADVKIVAGFTDVDWSGILGGGECGESVEDSLVAMPLSRIEAMCVHLLYKGTVVGSTTSINIPAFVGGPATTSADIIGHIKGSILAKVPSFIANAELFGESVVDKTAKGVGLLAMSSTMTGSGFGSVAGIVAADGVRGAIAAGKTARGADKNDGYKFGDFTRGSVRSLGQATKAGAELRRGDSGRYEVGDFTTGAASSAGQYASENKSRLGSAGGGGAGMMVGLALAGPIGLVAGSILGARAGRRAFEEDSQKQDSTLQDSTTSQATGAASQARILPHPSHYEQTQLPRAYQVPSEPSQYAQHTSAAHPVHVRQRAVSSTHHQQPYQAHPTQHQQQQQHGAMPNAYQQSAHQPPPQQHAYGANAYRQQHQQPPPQQQEQGYRFGDLTRSVTAAGKKKDGRSEKDGYKFGDFTRGFFGS